MTSTRSGHLNRIRSCLDSIFEDVEINKDWYKDRFDRSAVEELQTLLGAKLTSKGKKYKLLAPVLYPKGSKSEKDLFLNPALVNVSNFSYIVPPTWYIDERQVLKVILYGPSSLKGGLKCPGPKAAGTRWGLTKTTPGAIALAAIIVGFLVS